MDSGQQDCDHREPGTQRPDHRRRAGGERIAAGQLREVGVGGAEARDPLVAASSDRELGGTVNRLHNLVGEGGASESLASASRCREGCGERWDDNGGEQQASDQHGCGARQQ